MKVQIMCEWEERRRTKYPVSRVSGKKMIVASVSRRLGTNERQHLAMNAYYEGRTSGTYMTSFVSYEAIYQQDTKIVNFCPCNRLPIVQEQTLTLNV